MATRINATGLELSDVKLAFDNQDESCVLHQLEHSQAEVDFTSFPARSVLISGVLDFETDNDER